MLLSERVHHDVELTAVIQQIRERSYHGACGAQHSPGEVISQFDYGRGYTVTAFSAQQSTPPSQGFQIYRRERMSVRPIKRDVSLSLRGVANALSQHEFEETLVEICRTNLGLDNTRTEPRKT